MEIELILITIIFSIYAEFALWTICPKAVLTAKCYLFFLVLASVTDLILMSFADLPSIVMTEVTTAGIIGVVTSLIYAGIWFTYLSSSERVWATYRNEEN